MISLTKYGHMVNALTLYGHVVSSFLCNISCGTGNPQSPATGPRITADFQVQIGTRVQTKSSSSLKKWILFKTALVCVHVRQEPQLVIFLRKVRHIIWKLFRKPACSVSILHDQGHFRLFYNQCSCSYPWGIMAHKSVPSLVWDRHYCYELDLEDRLEKLQAAGKLSMNRVCFQ